MAPVKDDHVLEEFGGNCRSSVPPPECHGVPLIRINHPRRCRIECGVGIEKRLTDPSAVVLKTLTSFVSSIAPPKRIVLSAEHEHSCGKQIPRLICLIRTLGSCLALEAALPSLVSST